MNLMLVTKPEEDGMRIQVNDVDHDVPADATVADLLRQQIGEHINGVALAINDSVIPRSAWQDHHLHPEDRVLIVQAVQGG